MMKCILVVLVFVCFVYQPQERLYKNQFLDCENRMT